MFRPSQPAEPAAATQAASGTLPGEAHAHCRRHPGRLRLGLHRLNWAVGVTEGWREKRLEMRDVWWQVRHGTGRPAPFHLCEKPEDNPTENTNVIFLILLAFFSDTSGWCVQRQSFKKKKRERDLQGIGPSQDVNTHRSKQKDIWSSLNCLMFCLKWIETLFSPNPNAENNSTCLSHTFSRSNLFILVTLLCSL